MHMRQAAILKKLLIAALVMKNHMMLQYAYCRLEWCRYMSGNDLHGYFALRLFFAFLLLHFFLRFLGTGFVHQYHLQYFLFGLNASLSSQYRVPAPLLLWRHLSQSHGILFAFLMCSIEFIDVPYFPFDILKSSFFFKFIYNYVRKLFAENFLYKENLFVLLSEQ